MSKKQKGVDHSFPKPEMAQNDVWTGLWADWLQELIPTEPKLLFLISSSVNQLIISSVDTVVVWSMKCRKMVKK